jgi:hypothetical protein
MMLLSSWSLEVPHLQPCKQDLHSDPFYVLQPVGFERQHTSEQFI